MRELTMGEMSHVSGAGISDVLYSIGDHLASSILGGVTAAVVGGAIGYMHGGDATGILGLSLIGQLVGAAGGSIIGGVGGVIGGALVPLSYSLPLAIEAIQTLIGGGIR